MARRSTTHASKKSYKWCGQALTKIIDRGLDTTKGEVVVLCPAVSAEDYSDVVVERTLIQFHIRRANNTQLDAFAAVVAVQTVDNADTTRPSQIIDRGTTDSTRIRFAQL